MTNLDILYESTTPEVFFTKLIKTKEGFIGWAASKYSSLCPGFKEDFKQESLLYAWRSFPKTKKEHTKWQSFGMSWENWLLKNINWGAGNYLRKLYPKGKKHVFYENYYSDVERYYQFIKDDSIEEVSLLKEHEIKLTRLETAVAALPNIEKNMIDLYLSHGSVAASGRKLNMCACSSKWAYEFVFNMVKKDFTTLENGKLIFMPIHIPFESAFKKAFYYRLSRKHDQPYNRAFDLLLKSIKALKYDNIDIQNVDLPMCLQVIQHCASKNNLNPRSYLRPGMIAIMECVVQLNILRINPASKQRYRIENAIEQDELTAKRSEIYEKRRSKNNGQDATHPCVVTSNTNTNTTKALRNTYRYLPDEIIDTLKRLYYQSRPNELIASKIGVSTETLRNIFKKKIAHVKTAEKIYKFIDGLSNVIQKVA